MIKAIILTYDQQIGFAELVYKKYMELWPNCPFIFKVPFNNKNKCRSYNFFKEKNNTELIKSDVNIQKTMSILLKEFNEEEWIYWCIDDRYPIKIDVSILDGLSSLIKNNQLDNYNAVKLYNNCSLTNKEVNIFNNKFFIQKPKSMFGFWNHHFCKTKYIKYFFFNNYNKCLIKENGNKLFHNMNYVSMLENILVSKDNKIEFREPKTREKFFQTAKDDLKNYNCPIPNY